jgi:ATP-binding cassette subfamily B protein
MDCGPTCVRMVSKYYGREQSATSLRQNAGFSKAGVNLLGISNAAESIGFRTKGIRMTVNDLLECAPLPCILHWNQNHFVVLLQQRRRRIKDIKIADPAKGVIYFTREEFSRYWTNNKTEEGSGTALILEPTAVFYEQPNMGQGKLKWSGVLQYLKNARWQIVQLLLILLVTSAFQLVIPFLTQSIVDIGINTKNLEFITIVLVAQMMLLFSRTIVEFIRSHLLVYISVNLNFSLLSDFWIKITRLPIAYFDTYHTGDTLQRLRDSKKIESFLTGNVLNTFFSLFNFVLFAIVLASYNKLLFLVFFLGSLLYFFWIRLFLRLRRKINYQMFYLSAKESNISIQLVRGMQEIKLNSAEQFKRWEWENIQAALFKLQFRNLNISQKQQAGTLVINEGKNLFLTFLVAQMVIKGELTFGAMLAIQYVLGQLNGPIEQFTGFIQSGQDAKISLERLNEIHSLTEEEEQFGGKKMIKELPSTGSFQLKNVSFAYPGADNEPVLKNISLHIPANKTTAIVGVSGSGKTTLLKLLLKFYENYNGDIWVENSENENDVVQFRSLSPGFWRKQCGAVLQDGFIFDDSIAENIAVGEEQPSMEKLLHACETANIMSFIKSLSNGFDTVIGANGVGMSQGQKQRLLIARAVYKDPKYLFFDEATNALDANNEKTIVEHLRSIFTGKTVVVVAHRLSTVKNADNIIVLHNGSVSEEGTHSELTNLRGRYYELVKNQLELGS